MSDDSSKDKGVLPTDDMSDEEARKLLAEMDESPATVEETEMSEEDAVRLMAEMEGSDEASPASASSNETAIDLSDQEAAALLAEMDAPVLDDDAPSATTQEVSTIAATLPEEADEGEIAEWIENDFQKDPTMVEDFLTNVRDLIDQLDEKILVLEGSPDDKETIEEIFRAAHTLKGASGMFGFAGLERVMHRMENLFDKVRKGTLTPSSDIIDVMLEGMDVIKALAEAVANGQPSGAKTAPIVKALSDIAAGRSVNLKKPKAQSTESNAAEKPKAKVKKQESSTIRVDLQRLDNLVNLVGELVIDKTRFANIEEEIRTNQPHLKVTGTLAETVQHFGRHMNDVQSIIMKVRMVPIGNAFNKYPRIVRDLAKNLGKEIDLQISGESAELDKTLVEEIGDPLVHLIRNACDHGVENPETRVKSGKPPKGVVQLKAHQEGNQIVITIQDDGKGMDPEVLRKKAIEKGVISPDDQLTNTEIFNLIFEPGFSTAEVVTNVSGRGVGMDVVKKQINKLKGTIIIDSTLGSGSKIEIKLPLTLAIVQTLLIRSNGKTFAIPLDNVAELFRIKRNAIENVGDTLVTKLRDTVLPLMDLSDALNLPNHNDQTKDKEDLAYVAVIHLAQKRFGIVVDKLLTRQEMVIKPLGSILKSTKGIAGGALLGGGNVVLVIDVAELADSFNTRVASKAA